MTIRWPDARGWISIACFALVLIVLVMIWLDRTLLRDDFFKTVATALIVTAWLNGPVGWAFQATKAGGELAERNQAIVEQQATTANTTEASAQPAPVNLAEVGGKPVDSQ